MKTQLATPMSPMKINAALCGCLWEALALPLETMHTLDNTGATGYLDYLKLEDLKQVVTVGLDCDGRKFIAVKMQTASDYGKDGIHVRKGVMVLHQRYTDQLFPWVSAGGVAERVRLSPHDLTVAEMHVLVDLIKGNIPELVIPVTQFREACVVTLLHD